MLCTACGSGLPADGVFCPGCGVRQRQGPVEPGSALMAGRRHEVGALVMVVVVSAVLSGLVVHSLFQPSRPRAASATAQGAVTATASAGGAAPAPAVEASAPDTVTVPDFTGQSDRAAAQLARTAGLRPYVAQGSTSCGGPPIWGVGMSPINAQDPVPGTEVPRGSTVSLYYTARYRC